MSPKLFLEIIGTVKDHGLLGGLLTVGLLNGSNPSQHGAEPRMNNQNMVGTELGNLVFMLEISRSLMVDQRPKSIKIHVRFS